MARALHIINALLAAGLIGFSLWAWPELPDRIPVHFDASGEPTRWAETTFWNWYLLPLMALAMVALNYGLALVMPRYPKLVNLPDRRRLLDLPPESRQRVIAPVQEMLYALSVPLLMMFVLIQLAQYSEAHGGSGTGYTVTALVLAVLMTPIMLVGWLPRVQNALKREEAR
jgi:uncharacterized membrane protein